MNKILSVIIPTYNMEVLLPRCLDSFIIEKEYMDMLDVIIVNDGSKDNSSEIAHNYQELYPNMFKVIDKKNGNYGSCINEALMVAEGEYIKICDSDDRYYSEHLSEFLLLLINTKADIIFSPYDIFSFEGVLLKKMKVYSVNNGEVFNISDVNWKQPIIETYRAMHCICVKTDNLRKNDYLQLEGISYTDTQFVFYSVLYSETCTFFNKPIYKYFLGRDGQTMSEESMIKSHMHFYQNVRNMLDTYLNLDNSISENKSLLLYKCIFACFSFFANISIGLVRDASKETKLINKILVDAKDCKLQCPLYELSKKSIIFRLWHCYHIPARVIYYLYRIKSCLKVQ